MFKGHSNFGNKKLIVSEKSLGEILERYKVHEFKEEIISSIRDNAIKANFPTIRIRGRIYNFVPGGPGKVCPRCNGSGRI